MLKLVITLVILTIYHAQCDVKHIVQSTYNDISLSLEKPQSPLFLGTSSDYILASPSIVRINTKPNSAIGRSSSIVPYNPTIHKLISHKTIRPLPQPQLSQSYNPTSHNLASHQAIRPLPQPEPNLSQSYPTSYNFASHQTIRPLPQPRPPYNRPLAYSTTPRSSPAPYKPHPPPPTRPSHLVPQLARQDAKILKQNFDLHPAGNYHQSFESDNGISVQEQGDIRQLGPDKSVLEVSGSYSYTAPDGTLIELSYIANENGFQPQGAHLPTPPPIPEAIQRALEYIKNHPYVDKYTK